MVDGLVPRTQFAWGGVHENSPAEAALASFSIEEFAQVPALATSRCIPHGLVVRAQIVLRAPESISDEAIAQKLGLSTVAVAKWRGRYLARGIQGVYDECDPVVRIISPKM